MRITILCALLLVENGLAFASEDEPSFDNLGFSNSFSRFIASHKRSIVDLTNTDITDSAEILGLDMTDASPVIRPELGKLLTNVVSVRMRTGKSEVPGAYFSMLTNLPQLEYFHVQCGNANTIADSARFLTNLIRLRYLGIVAPSATNIDRSVYENKCLKELFLYIGAADLPRGISRLSHLEMLEIVGNKAKPIKRLPSDISQSSIRRLSIGGVSGIDAMLPELPGQLLRLAVVNCQLINVPPMWFKSQGLRVVNLSGNQIEEIPLELLSLPSLQIIDLGLNSISNVPPITVSSDRAVKVNLTGNPIQGFAPANWTLVERGIIVK